MKLSVITLLFLFTAAFLLVITNAQDKPKTDANAYIGVEACGMCHKTDKQGNQLSIWKETRHANAFKTLQSDKANEIAKELGHPTPAAETEACLKCHVSGMNLDASLLDKKFNLADGVQCETCHGPGSNYKSLKVMKDRELAVANGLKVYDNKEDLCVKCHNEESPTFKPMDFSEAWEKIKHPVPAK